jgi:hydrogenase-4 component E
LNLLTILLLFAALLLSRVSNLRTAVNILLAQSIMVTVACLLAGWNTGETHMYVAALLTVLIKAGLIPYALFRVVKILRHEREVNHILGPNYSFIAAAMLIFLAYWLIDRQLPGAVSRDALAASVSLTLIGLLIIMTRRQAVMQIVGLITMENGLYLLGLSVTMGLPLIIELGIFLDVLVAVVVLVILTYRLKLSFMTTDTGVLKKLRG